MKLRVLIVFSCVIALAACGGGTVSEPESGGPPAGTRENPFVGTGFVRELGDGALVIQHEAIPGFMGAMTMSYPVSQEVDLRQLVAGEQVRFEIERLEPDGYQIFRLEEIETP